MCVAIKDYFYSSSFWFEFLSYFLGEHFKSTTLERSPENFWWCWDSNAELQGGKSKFFLCAKQPPFYASSKQRRFLGDLHCLAFPPIGSLDNSRWWAFPSMDNRLWPKKLADILSFGIFVFFSQCHLLLLLSCRVIQFFFLSFDWFSSFWCIEVFFD